MSREEPKKDFSLDEKKWTSFQRSIFLMSSQAYGARVYPSELTNTWRQHYTDYQT